MLECLLRCIVLRIYAINENIKSEIVLCRFARPHTSLREPCLVSVVHKQCPSIVAAPPKIEMWQKYHKFLILISCLTYITLGGASLTVSIF